MSSKPIVVMVDRDPRSVRAMLDNGSSAELPYSLLLVRFELDMPTLVRSIIGYQPSWVVLGSGFGMGVNIGERFFSQLKEAGFKGSVAVCCGDTHEVLPLSAEVKRLDHEQFSRATFHELFGR